MFKLFDLHTVKYNQHRERTNITVKLNGQGKNTQIYIYIVYIYILYLHKYIFLDDNLILYVCYTNTHLV